MTGTEESKLYLRKKRYIGLTMVIMLTSAVFLLLLTLSGGEKSEAKTAQEQKAYQKIKSTYAEKEGWSADKREVVYFIGDRDSGIPEVLQFQKFQVTELEQVTELPETAEGMLVLDAGKLSSDSKVEQLELACRKNIRIVLYNIEKLELQSESVKELLGIREAGRTKHYKGIRILDGFWTDVPMTEKKYEYQALDLKLENGRQIYMTEYAKDYEKEEVIPLLYRQIYKNTEIFVVNGPLMDDMPQGIIRGVFMQGSRTYLYPVVNASICAITSFPLLADENEAVLKEKYNRNVKQFSEDILMPDMMTVCTNLKQKPTLFARASIQEKEADWPSVLTYYQKEVEKNNGELGIMLEPSAVDEWDAWNKQYMGETDIGSIISADRTKSLKYKKEMTAKVEEDPYTNLPVSSVTEDGVTLFKVYDLINTDERMTLNYWASVYGYGLSTMGANMEEIYYPDGKEWNETSKEITRKVANTVDQMRLLEPCTVWEAAVKVQQYSLMEPEITYDEDEINVHISYFAGAADFILKTDRQITEAAGCTYEQTGEGMYLIRADKETVKIGLEPADLEY